MRNPASSSLAYSFIKALLLLMKKFGVVDDSEAFDRAWARRSLSVMFAPLMSMTPVDCRGMTVGSTSAHWDHEYHKKLAYRKDYKLLTFNSLLVCIIDIVER